MSELSREAGGDDEATMWALQWTELLGMASGIVNAADSVMDAMRGDLGPGIARTDREGAAHEVKRRITDYVEKRKALIAYAREWEAMLEAASDA